MNDQQILATLAQIEVDLRYLGKRMTRTQATASDCLTKVTAIKQELEQRLTILAESSAR